MNLQPTYEDAFNLLCGEKIGEGCHRTVYECRLRPELVAKVECEDGWRYFANVVEMRFWNENSEVNEIKAWLAPCEYMSPDGRILLQRRCEPVPKDFKLPKKVPSFLADLKRSNFGMLKGKLVCVDYAITIESPSVELKKARWR